MSQHNMVSLGDLIAPAPTKRAKDRAYPVLSITMHEGLVPREERFKKSMASKDTRNYKVVGRGELVVGFPIDEGVIYFQDTFPEAIVSPAYKIWRIKENAPIDERYLGIALRHPISLQYYRSKMRGTTARRRSLPDSLFLGLRIPLPSLDEQRRIADILDRAQSIIATSKEKCRKVEILKSSFTESIVKSSTKWQRLEEIAEVTGGLSLNRKRQDLPQKVPYLRVANVHRGALDLSDLKHFGASNRELERTLLLRDDILMVEAHANQFEVGRAAILNESVPGLTHQNHLFKVRTKGLPPRALEALLNSYFARRQLVKQAKTTSGLFTINISGARSLTLPVLSEQMSRTLDRRLGEISKLHADSLKRQESADQLYNSLATRAFAGEL